MSYKAIPKNYRCLDCGREQYTNEKCFDCGSESFERLKTLKEEELRQLLQNKIAIMSYEELKRVSGLLKSSN